jgi:hypothetical protein
LGALVISIICHIRIANQFNNLSRIRNTKKRS